MALAWLSLCTCFSTLLPFSSRSPIARFLNPALSLLVFISAAASAAPSPTPAPSSAYCDNITAVFTSCIYENLNSGACYMAWNDSGDIALCQPCLQYYAPWTTCLVCPSLPSAVSGRRKAHLLLVSLFLARQLLLRLPAAVLVVLDVHRAVRLRRRILPRRSADLGLLPGQ